MGLWIISEVYTLERIRPKKKLLLNSKGKITKNFTQHGYIQVKQHSIVKYLRCLFDETISGDAMALNVVSKINNKQKFIYRYFFDTSTETLTL